MDEILRVKTNQSVRVLLYPTAFFNHNRYHSPLLHHHEEILDSICGRVGYAGWTHPSH
jgi:hypothetical protein